MACQQCGERPATENWVGEGGYLALSHGLYRRWCERCVVVAQLEHARKTVAAIPDLETRLRELEKA